MSPIYIMIIQIRTIGRRFDVSDKTDAFGDPAGGRTAV